MNYQALSNQAAIDVIKEFAEPVLINEQKCLGIFVYPTEDQLIKRSGGQASQALIKAQMRVPELHLHKGSGRFEKNQIVKLVNRPESPVFYCADFDYNAGHLYRIELNHVQPDPVDSKGRKWR